MQDHNSYTAFEQRQEILLLPFGAQHVIKHHRIEVWRDGSCKQCMSRRAHERGA